MSDWRRNHSENYHQDFPRAPMRSQNRKPPLGFWQPTVPLWEKKFCTTVGAIPWRRLLEAKKMISFYKNVIQWNDSAGEEAFHNAKARFWAKINGLPCNITLPDPDIYIDEIDWNPDIDPELILDLDREPVPPDEGEKDGGEVGLRGDSLFFNNAPVQCSGWGDAEEDPIKMESTPYVGDCDRNTSNEDNPWERGYVEVNGNAMDRTWGDCDRNALHEYNPWEQGYVEANQTVKDNTWGDSGDNSWGWYGWQNNINESDNLKSRRSGGSWGTWNESRRKQESTGHMSRYKTSRFQGDDYEFGWRNGRGKKRTSFSYEHPRMDKKPLAPRQWNAIHACGPISHHGSGESGNPWSWEKQVS